MTEQNIVCPNCGDNILFDVNALLIGASFECASCDSKIQLSNESKEVVQKSIEELNNIKNSVLKN